jgi:hypothetical protein
MVIGAGIFRTPPLVAQSLGSDGGVLFAWALGGAFALIGALCYAELSAAFPDTGGDYRFLREAFGADAAYLFAWSRFAVIFSASGALLAFVGIDYLAELVPMDTMTRAVLAGTMVIALTVLNLQGVQIGTRAQIAMVALDVMALLALGAAALWLVSQGVSPVPPASAPAAAPLSLGGFGQAMIFIMLAYGGFNDASTLSAEVRTPRDMTRALVGGMAMIMDQAAGTIVMLQPAQRMAMELPIGAQGGASGPDMHSMLDPNKYRFERTGSDRVLNQPCTVWRFSEKAGAANGTACITSDGVMLRTETTHQGRPTRMEAVSVSLTAQPASLFEVPAGYQRMQMPGAGQGGPPARRQSSAARSLAAGHHPDVVDRVFQRVQRRRGGEHPAAERRRRGGLRGGGRRRLGHGDPGGGFGRFLGRAAQAARHGDA